MNPPTLMDEWLGCREAISILDVSSLDAVREKIREEGDALCLWPNVTARLVVAARALARNQLAHAREGKIAVVAIERDSPDISLRGLEIIAADVGCGIADPTAALKPKEHSNGGLGVGLASLVELADELDFDIRIGEGTCVRARVFATRRAHSRQVGIFGKRLDIGFEQSDCDVGAHIYSASSDSHLNTKQITKTPIPLDSNLLGEHPITIAHQILKRFAPNERDALALVVL